MLVILNNDNIHYYHLLTINIIKMFLVKALSPLLAAT